MAKKFNTDFAKIIPIAGWIIVILGLIFPIENIFIRIVWLLIVIACAGVHILQLFVSIPIGRKAGFGYPEIIFKTLLYGAAWWLPIKLSMANEGKS